MLYAAAFPRQKKALWHKALCGPARDFRGEERALQPTASCGTCPEAGGAPSKRGQTRRGTKSPAFTIRLCGRGRAVRGRTWSRTQRRAGRPVRRWGDRAPRSFRRRHRARLSTGRRATAPTPPPEPRTLRGSPRRDGRARALRPHCVAGAAWPSARGAPRAGSGAARAGRGGGRGERLFIAPEAPPARAAFFRGSLACVLRRADGRGFHAEPVQGAASALRGGQERAVAASGDSPKDARVESPSAVTFHRAEVSGGHLVSGCPLVSGTLFISALFSATRRRRTEPGSVPVWRYGQTSVGSGRSRAIPTGRWNPRDSSFPGAGSSCLGHAASTQKTPHRDCRGSRRERRLAPPRRRRGGE